MPGIDYEVAALMEEKDRAIMAMRRMNRSLGDITVARQLDQLELAGLQIMDQVISDRRTLGQVRKFMICYLPLGNRLLNRSVLKEDPVQARAVLDVMVSAFHRQYNALCRGEVLNIAEDLAYSEQQLSQAGLGGQ